MGNPEGKRPLGIPSSRWEDKKINGPSIKRMGEGVKFNWSQDS